MYRCEICGAVFDRPLINEYYEPRPDCFYERFKQMLCPICGQAYFDEIKEDNHADEDSDD